MTKDEVAERFFATRDREAMATLVMRIRRLDVDRALFLLEGFAEKLMEISRESGYQQGQFDAQEQQECEETFNGD